MSKRIYPAIFHKDDDVVWVEFPDLSGCFTQADTVEEALKMASEALALWLDGVEEVPPASAIDDVRSDVNSVVMLVEEGEV